MLSHLASPQVPTGAERSLALLAGGLAGRGHQVAVAAPGPWAPSAALAVDGVLVASLPVRACWLVQYGPQPTWRQLVRAARYAIPDAGAARLRVWLEEWRPEVVHVNCLPHLRGAAVAAAAGFPVVWHVREILPRGPRRRWFARRLRRDATRIVAVSEAVADWLREEGLGDLVEVVYNGVDRPDPFPDRRSAEQLFGFSTGGIVVGLFSQLVAHKGGLDFVRAARRAASEEPSLMFVIAGHGPERFVRYLERAIDAGIAGDIVRLLPPQDDIWRLLAAVDVVALTTRWPDPLPRVVMEAMAASRPVIAYGGGGVPEMVVDGETGVLLDPGDEDGLAAAMVSLARNPSLRTRLGRAGRERAARLFTVDRHVDRMEGVLGRAAQIVPADR